MERTWVSSSVALGNGVAPEIEQCTETMRAEANVDLIGPDVDAFNQAIRKARWRVPDNSGQVVPISAARSISRLCVDGSESRVSW
jgi:hypothetical protein